MENLFVEICAHTAIMAGLGYAGIGWYRAICICRQTPVRMAAGKTAEGFSVPPHKRERSRHRGIAAPVCATKNSITSQVV